MQMAEDIVRILPRTSTIILVFDPEPPSGIDTEGKKNAGAQNTRGGKICAIRLKSPFISETARDRHMVAMEH